MEDDVLRTGEVAAIIRRNGRKVRRMCQQGRHFKNAFRDDGGQWFIPRSDVDAYLDFRRRNTERARRVAKNRSQSGQPGHKSPSTPADTTKEMW